FVGDTSPVRYIRETAEATGRLVRRALDAGFERVLVDTGGLVEGPLGLALKRAKVRAADPDLVLVLQRREESEPIARALESAARPRVLRLAPSPAVVRRTATRRREHREPALRPLLRAGAGAAASARRGRRRTADATRRAARRRRRVSRRRGARARGGVRRARRGGRAGRRRRAGPLRARGADPVGVSPIARDGHPAREREGADP